MKVVINNKEVEVIIERKVSNKNTYLRVKDNLNIYITTNRKGDKWRRKLS